jgi:hypothetical protein
VTSDVLVNANIKADAKISTPVDTDALSILDEIEGVLEDQAKAKLPEVPTNIPSSTLRKPVSVEEQSVPSEERVLIES